MRNLDWNVPEDLFIMTKCVQQSINSSMRYLDQECSTTCLKLRPTYVTKNVASVSTNILRNIDKYNQVPVIVLDIEAHKVEMALVYQYGPKVCNMMISDKWRIHDAASFTESGEKFFGNITNYCFKMCSQFSENSNNHLAGKKLKCAVIFRFEFNQTSLRNSQATKFSKNFQVDNCEGKNLVSIFNEQLSQHQPGHDFHIECTNLVNSSTARMMGLCMTMHSGQPDLLIMVNQGENACLFAENHDIVGFENDSMLIGTQIKNFGISIGSLEHNLLTKFLGPIDYEIYNAHNDKSNLFGKFVAGVRMCELVWRYIIKTNPTIPDKFPLFRDPKSIREIDISNLLASFSMPLEHNENLQSRLMWIYDDMNEMQQKEFYEVCLTVVRRSAKIMAAVTLGMMMSIYSQNPRNTIVVALDGCVMLNMYQYKATFKETLHQLHRLCGVPFEIEYVEPECSASNLYFGVASLCRFISG